MRARVNTRVFRQPIANKTICERRSLSSSIYVNLHVNNLRQPTRQQFTSTYTSTILRHRLCQLRHRQFTSSTMNQLSLSVAHSGRMLFSFISCFILSIHLSLGLPLGRDPGT